MNIYEIIALIGGAVTVFWTILQIVTYMREKGANNVRVTVFLMIFIIGGLVFIVYKYPFVKKTLKNNDIKEIAPRAVKTLIIATTPAITNQIKNDIKEENREKEQTGNVEVLPLSIYSPGDVNQIDQTFPSSEPSPVELPVQNEKKKPALLKSSFVLDIKRNMLGGIGSISAKCTFAEIEAIDVELISYKLTVNYLDSPEMPEDKAVTRSFDRTLDERIRIQAGSTLVREIKFDNEIGDLLIKSKKSGKTGWVRIEWSGIDVNGNSITSESTANKPEQG